MEKEFVLLPSEIGGNGMNGNGLCGNGMNGNGQNIDFDILQDIEIEELMKDFV